MKFGQLPDGVRFRIGSQIFIKTLEDAGSHNAVNAKDSSLAIFVPDQFMVQPA